MSLIRRDYKGTAVDDKAQSFARSRWALQTGVLGATSMQWCQRPGRCRSERGAESIVGGGVDTVC